MVFVQICRIITILCCCGSLLNLLFTTFSAASAPQQAAGAALSVAWVVIPYIFTRSVTGFPFPPEKAS